MKSSQRAAVISHKMRLRKKRCLVCRRVSPANVLQCIHCNASFPENRVPATIKYPRPDEIVVPLISCPQCSRLLRRDASLCPDCFTTITAVYANESLDANKRSTQAFVRAKHIESLNPAAFLLLTVAVAIGFIANITGPRSFVWLLVLPLISCLIMLFMIVRWIDRFASPAPEDDDFMIAFRKVRSAFWIWLAVTLAQVVGLLTLIRTS